MNMILLSACLALTSVALDSPQSIYEKGLNTLKESQTVSGTFVSTTPDGKYEGSFQLAKPNKFSVIIPNLEHRSDGYVAWLYFPEKNEYFPGSTDLPFVYPLNAFMESTSLKTESIEMTKWNGRDVVKVTLVKPEFSLATRQIFLDTDTGLPIGGRVEEEERVSEIVFSELKYNEDIPDTVFAWEPPADAKERIFDKPTGKEDLLNQGIKAPDFSLKTPSGETINLYDHLKGKKAVIVNFWFIACGPCRSELPHLQEIYEDLKDEGFGLVAVNVSDQAEAINKFVADSKYTFPVVMNQLETKYNAKKAYGVQGCPTSYVIAPDGTILASFVGYGETTMEEIKERLSMAGLPVKE